MKSDVFKPHFGRHRLATFTGSLILCVVCHSASASSRIELGTAATKTEQANTSVSSVTLDSQQATADFDLLRGSLQEAHPGLYRYTSRAVIDRMFARERKKLNHTVTRIEFVRIVAETLASIRCGHTLYEQDALTRAAMTSARKFPLSVQMEGARLIVVLNQSDGTTIHPGAEILAVDGQPTSKIIAMMWTVLAGDGDIQTGRARQIRHFDQLYWLLFGQTEHFTVKVREASGSVHVVELKGVTDAEREKSNNPLNAPVMTGFQKISWTRDNVAVRFFRDGEVAELHIGYFLGDDFPKKLGDVFKALHERKTKALIIDLRGNGGGHDQYGALLVSELRDAPFAYFDHIDVKTLDPSFLADTNLTQAALDKLRTGTVAETSGGFRITPAYHSGVGMQAPEKNSFEGPVYVLIDGNTFSTAADVCAILRHLKRAVFIGEETGGAYFGNNSGLEATLKLPNSGVKVTVPFYGYWNAVTEQENARRGIQPAYIKPTTVQSLIDGRDDALSSALNLIHF